MLSSYAMTCSGYVTAGSRQRDGVHTGITGRSGPTLKQGGINAEERWFHERFSEFSAYYAAARRTLPYHVISELEFGRRSSIIEQPRAASLS
jgi:hypothetical protein